MEQQQPWAKLGAPTTTMTTITASMNANGEADPIDGIVSIKSSAASASRLATGTHTPFGAGGWRAAAAAGLLPPAASLMSPTAGLLPPAAYMLPKDLSEAACMGFDVAASMGCCDSASAPPTAGSATARMGAFTIADDAGSATAAGSSPAAAGSSASAGSSIMAGGFLSAQLSNSSFYKPLSSISLPGRRTSSAAVTAADADSGDSKGADSVAALLAGSMPPISLAEVNAALNALVEQGSADLWAADGGVGVGALKRGLAAAAAEEGSGAPLLPPGKRRRGGGGGLALDSDYDDDDWLLAMDQLVDTEALLTKSPPSTPVDAPPQRLVSAARMDPLARWDRIPVNIFRRSRALA
ncbi:hypothetical protein GGF42_009257, partial [Coemansia sp. RSA 2424]